MFPSSSPHCNEEDAAETATDMINMLVTDDDIDHAVDHPFSSQELLYADVAIAIGQNCSALLEHEYSLSLNHPAYLATIEDLESFDTWDSTSVSLLVTVLVSKKMCSFHLLFNGTLPSFLLLPIDTLNQTLHHSIDQQHQKPVWS